MDLFSGRGRRRFERDVEIVRGEEGVDGCDCGLLIGTVFVKVERGDSDGGGAAADETDVGVAVVERGWWWIGVFGLATVGGGGLSHFSGEWFFV